MLLQLFSINLSNPLLSYVTALIKYDNGIIVNLSNIPISKDLFALSRLSTNLTETINITSYEIIENETGKINLYFDSTTLTPNINYGDIICIYEGTEKSQILGDVVATSTINTGVGTVETTGENMFIKAPDIHKSVASKYTLNITYATENGINIIDTLINLPLPIIINGVVIKSILISPINGTSFKGGDIIEFKITYYDDINGLGNPVQFYGTSSDILVATLIPE